MEDLDRVTSSRAFEAGQLADLAALGLDWDGPVVRQSERFDRYNRALDALTTAGLTYECYCTRREIREAAAAPHGPEVRYPGTCRTLTARRAAGRRREGRPPAIRLRASGEEVTVHDRLAGDVTGVVDDLVLRRNDGVPAYNLAVVIDDAAQAVEEVVRGDDLLASTPSQVHLAGLLGLAMPTYAHVPLVLGPDGQRLAKRHGAVTLADLAVRGRSAADVRAWLAVSLGLAGPGEGVTAAELASRFDPAVLPREPWTLSPAELG
jgi:glutamyl-tRNA synthetase